MIEVYTEWSGNCTSVLPTLQKLRAEMEDDESMQFLSVSPRLAGSRSLPAEERLPSPRNPGCGNGSRPSRRLGWVTAALTGGARAAQCPDDMETDIELIAEHKLKSEPLFLVYRNGTLMETIEGANTPAIKRAVKEHFPNPDLEVDDLDENPLYVLRREREKAEAEAEAEKK